MTPKKIYLSLIKDYTYQHFPTLNLSLNGALTGRPYPFTIRVWEHTYKSSIDFTDGFGQLLRAGIAYDKVRRVLPNLTSNVEDTPWINDRTRFSFEGLPSRAAIRSVFVKKKKRNEQKKKLTEIILLLFYFYDHLNKHLVNIGYFVLVFGTSISLELISLLLFTFYRYSFLRIRTAEILPQNNDIESSFQLNSSTTNLSNLLKSDLCLLIGVNTRYEGSYLNLKLRKRYLKSDFNIVSLSSLIDLTFPVFLLGSTLKIMSSILEGNCLINRVFKSSSYPIIILNSDYFRRLDSRNCNTFIETLKSYTRFCTKNWNGLNVLNFSLNNVGANLLHRFSAIQPTDFTRYNTMYFLNTPMYVFAIKKVLELRVLDYLADKKRYEFFYSHYDYSSITYPRIAIYQSSGIENRFWFTRAFKKKGNNRSYFYIPTENFYNNAGTYVNTEGFFKKSASIIVSKLNLKNDWKFLRRIFRYTRKRLFFTKDIQDKKRLFFRSKNSFRFKNFFALHLLPIRVFTRLLFYQLSENKSFVEKPSMFFLLLAKKFNTKIKFWLQDFYLGNRDLYSRQSKTMVKCSTYVKQGKLNFTYVDVDGEGEGPPVPQPPVAPARAPVVRPLTTPVVTVIIAKPFESRESESQDEITAEHLAVEPNAARETPEAGAPVVRPLTTPVVTVIIAKPFESRESESQDEITAEHLAVEPNAARETPEAGAPVVRPLTTPVVTVIIAKPFESRESESQDEITAEHLAVEPNAARETPEAGAPVVRPLTTPVVTVIIAKPFESRESESQDEITAEHLAVEPNAARETPEAGAPVVRPLTTPVVTVIIAKPFESRESESQDEITAEHLAVEPNAARETPEAGAPVVRPLTTPVVTVIIAKPFESRESESQDEITAEHLAVEPNAARETPKAKAKAKGEGPAPKAKAKAKGEGPAPKAKAKAKGEGPAPKAKAKAKGEGPAPKAKAKAKGEGPAPKAKAKAKGEGPAPKAKAKAKGEGPAPKGPTPKGKKGGPKQ